MSCLPTSGVPTCSAAQFSGIVITGSKFDAHGMDPWIVKLRQLLKEVYEQGSIRMLGVCFGCQVRSSVLGEVPHMVTRTESFVEYLLACETFF